MSVNFPLTQALWTRVQSGLPAPYQAKTYSCIKTNALRGLVVLAGIVAVAVTPAFLLLDLLYLAARAASCVKPKNSIIIAPKNKPSITDEAKKRIEISPSTPLLPKDFNAEQFLKRMQEKGVGETLPTNVNHSVYATSNEFGQKNIRELLKKAEKIPGGVHLGVSGLYNWDIIAQMGSSFAILGDYNPKVVAFNQKMLSLLVKATTPDEFVQMALKEMEADIQKNPKFYSENFVYEMTGLLPENTSLINALSFALNRMLLREDGALSKEHFHVLQKMAKDGKIVCMQLDLTNAEALKEIAGAVHEQGFVFSSLYFSNVYDWIAENVAATKSFKEGIKALSEALTLIIDSSYVGLIAGMIRSYLLYGKDPATGNEYDPDVVRGVKRNVKRADYYKLPTPLLTDQWGGIPPISEQEFLD